jgi:hypothetical protein
MREPWEQRCNGERKQDISPLPPCPLSSLVLLCLLMSGCAGRPVNFTGPAFEASRVKQISVAAFGGPGGQAASDEFVRQLLGTGIGVTDAHHPGNVLLEGTVSDYKANNQLMVFLGDDNPMITPSAQGSPAEATLASHKSPMASVVASVGIQARLVENATHRIVWADSFTYEGLDLPTALNAVVGALTTSLARTLPQMNRPKS